MFTLALIIHVLHVEKRPAPAILLLCWMVDLIVLVASLYFFAEAWMFMVDLVNYVKWGI